MKQKRRLQTGIFLKPWIISTVSSKKKTYLKQKRLKQTQRTLQKSNYLEYWSIIKLLDPTTGVSFFSAHLDNKQKSFIPKKNCGMLLFEALKIKKSDFLNSNTC